MGEPLLQPTISSPKQVSTGVRLKQVIKRLFPGIKVYVQAMRMRKRCKLLFEERQKANQTRIFGSSDIYVLSGPFSGMRYLNEIVWGPIEPKWIGSYEAECQNLFYVIYY